MDEEGDGVWAQTVRRLDQRDHPKWDSLSWVALRPLIASINDRVNWAAPQLVLDLRQEWLAKAEKHSGTGKYEGIVDRSDVTEFILMGDTGEQDASQYVVTPALEAAMSSHPDDGKPPFAIICSDVIYPSGDINDYVHGFYLPYENLLRTGRGNAGASPQRIYGLPGNHDWYDGLTGFMHTFCGVDELDASAYRWPDHASLPATGPGSSSWRKRLHVEGIGRLLWRRPSLALSAPLHRGDQPETPARMRAELEPPALPGTAQPGPYFAIKIKGLLIVCIDGGIGLGQGDSMIDAVQGRWLIDISERVPGPKVLLTGYPLLVNGEWKLCMIEGAAQAKRHGQWEGPTTVGEIVATRRYGYVAAIGGDIHNFQHYRLPVGGLDGHVVTYLVSGGGGAYISATHPVPAAAHYLAERSRANDTAIRDANAVRGGPPRPEDFESKSAGVARKADAAVLADKAHRALGPLPSTGEHEMIPAPPLSLSHFSDEVLPMTWRFIRLMLCWVAGLVAGTAIAQSTQISRPAAMVALGTVAAAGTARALFPHIAPPRRTKDEGRARLHAYRAGAAGVAVLSGAGAALIAWQLSETGARRYLGAWAVVSLLAAVLATLQRRSGWWREHGLDQRPSLRPGGPPRSTDLLASSIVWGVLALAAAAAVLIWLFGFGANVIWLGVAGVLLIAVAIAGWRVRERSWWRSHSQNTALVAQLAAAVLAFSAAPGRHAALRPLGVVTGIVLDVVLLILALASTVGAIAGLARLMPGRDGDWRVQVGRWGHIAPPLIGALLLAALAGLSSLPWFGRGHRSAFADFARVAICFGWGLALVVLGVFGIDALRRRFPVHYRWIATAILAVVVGTALWGHANDKWLGTGLVVMTIGVTLGAISISAGYLAFLGGHNMFFDWPAHRDVEDRSSVDGRPLSLIPIPEAKKVLKWRQTSVGGEQLNRTIRNRAKFVFPSTDQPRGIIQQKVSEFFSTDRPPFFQHFLTVRVTESAVDITPQVVTGQTPAAADTRATIRIPL